MERWYFDEKNHKLNTEGNCIRKYSIKIFKNYVFSHFFLQDKKPIHLQKVEEPDSSTGSTLEFQDPRLHLKSAFRQRRQFEFKQPGEYEKLAKMQRSKAKLEQLQVFYSFNIKIIFF